MSENIPDHPSSNIEAYLADIAGLPGSEKPEHPYSRVEQYLDYISEHGGGGGGMPDPSQYEDGTVLIKVGDEWKPQTGYGYVSGAPFEPITWDGDTEGLETFFNGTTVFYKVSDNVPSFSDVTGSSMIGHITFYTEPVEFSTNVTADGNNWICEGNGGWPFDQVLAYGFLEDTYVDGQLVTKGVYFWKVVGPDYTITILSLSKGQGEVHKFDKDLIPSKLVVRLICTYDEESGEDVYTVDKTFDEIAAAFPDVIMYLDPGYEEELHYTCLTPSALDLYPPDSGNTSVVIFKQVYADPYGAGQSTVSLYSDNTIEWCEEYLDPRLKELNDGICWNYEAHITNEVSDIQLDPIWTTDEGSEVENKMTFTFTATSSNFSVTAPEGMILGDETGFAGLSEGNTISYTNLTIGSIYEVNCKTLDDTHIAMTMKEWKTA